MNSNKIRYNNTRIKNLTLEYTSKNRGETQASVAEKIGVSVTTLFYANPTVETLCKAANFFQCDLNYFFDIPESILADGIQRNLVTTPPTEYQVLKTNERDNIYKEINELKANHEKILEEINSLRNLLTELKLK